MEFEYKNRLMTKPNETTRIQSRNAENSGLSPTIRPIVRRHRTFNFRQARRAEIIHTLNSVERLCLRLHATRYNPGVSRLQ